MNSNYKQKKIKRKFKDNIVFVFFNNYFDIISIVVIENIINILEANTEANYAN